MCRKVQFYTDNPAFGGGNKYFVDLIEAVEDRVDVQVLTNKNGFFEKDRSRLSPKIKVNSTFIFKWRVNLSSQRTKGTYVLAKAKDLLSPVFLVLNFFKLLNHLRKFKPHLVVSSNGGYPAAESTLAMVLAARTLNIPVILTVVSLPGKRRKLLWLYDCFLDKVISYSVARVVVNSLSQKSALSKIRGFDENKITCIYNGIENGEVVKQNCSQHYDKNRLTLGYVGRLDKLKGVEYALKAVAQCRSKSKVKLIVVGEGPEIENLVELSSSYGLNGDIEFRKFVNDSISNIHKEFSVFIFPSLWEGLPYSILEAMRSGLPIISTNVGGIPEAITHMENGILVNPGNVEELCNAIDLLNESDDLLELFSEKARNRFEKDFTIDVMKKRFRLLISQHINYN